MSVIKDMILRDTSEGVSAKDQQYIQSRDV